MHQLFPAIRWLGTELGENRIPMKAFHRPSVGAEGKEEDHCLHWAGCRGRGPEDIGCEKMDTDSSEAGA